MIYDAKFTSRAVFIIRAEQDGTTLWERPFSFDMQKRTHFYHYPYVPDRPSMAAPGTKIERETLRFTYSNPESWHNLAGIESAPETRDDDNSTMGSPWVNHEIKLNETRDLNQLVLDSNTVYHLVEGYVVYVPGSARNDKSLGQLTDDVMVKALEGVADKALKLVGGKLASVVAKKSLAILTSYIPDDKDQMVLVPLKGRYLDGTKTTSDVIPVSLAAHSGEFDNWASSPELWVSGAGSFTRELHESFLSHKMMNSSDTVDLDVTVQTEPQARLLVRRGQSVGSQ